jgi:predicted acylesterase/phospholipase RssA
MKIVQLIYAWVRRLPWKFTVPFALLLVLWLFFVALLFDRYGVSQITDLLFSLFGYKLPSLKEPASGFVYPKLLIRLIVDSLVSLAIVAIAVITSYNLAALIYRRIRKHPPGKASVHAPTSSESGSDETIKKFTERYRIEDLSIGLILAGGGAKGAYQAGALKAIYEFLEKNNALDRVKMIAGTSIGSWNSMFWLAGLVKPPDGKRPSAHEQWWRTISVDRIMEFSAYWPLRRNYFLTSQPWQEMFEEIFVNEATVNASLSKLFAANDNGSFNFYLTRSNVARGHLEFATNNVRLPNMKRKNWKTNEEEPLIDSDLYELIDFQAENPLEKLKTAVFASMDLPPLFPYMRIKSDMSQWFEDGGVVDNLPMRFGTEIEKCNLLFVLPLNASFAEKVSHNSVTRRLFRVMDIRQGVLEHNSIKLARLYNDKVRLENELNALRNDSDRQPQQSLLSVFAICPDQPLAIGTAEFWKPAEAGEAFDLMYAATRKALNDKFIELTDPNALKMTLVGPTGETKIRDDF